MIQNSIALIFSPSLEIRIMVIII